MNGTEGNLSVADAMLNIPKLKGLELTDIEKEKGKMFTFAIGEYRNGLRGPLVIVMEGKRKLKPRKDKNHSKRYSHYISTKGYVTCLHVEAFEFLSGRKIKAGEVRHGRLKFKMSKRKKK